MASAVSVDPGFARTRERLVEAIDAQLAAVAASGRTAEDLGDLDDLAAKVGAAIPTGHPVADLVGPCYDTPGLTAWLGISKQALDKRNRTGAVLACRTSDGHWVYPAFQFDADGRPLPHLREVIAVLTGEGGADRWRVASWLAAPSPDLPGKVPAAEWLRGGDDPTPVLLAARADAARWAA